MGNPELPQNKVTKMNVHKWAYCTVRNFWYRKISCAARTILNTDFAFQLETHVENTLFVLWKCDHYNFALLLLCEFWEQSDGFMNSAAIFPEIPPKFVGNEKTQAK